MPIPLLTTKLNIPPVRPRERVVPRPRLIERLNEGPRLRRKLTLISAPAGFGKTTLLSEWAHAMGESPLPIAALGESPLPIAALGEAPPRVAFAWLSLDEGDNDLARFLAYLGGALSRIEGLEATTGQGALGLLQVSQPQAPPTEAVLTALINELAEFPDTLILILDDYHSVDSWPVEDALAFLLEHLPPQIYLVIATREDPRLPLARLRARGHLTELRAVDLRFTPSEAAEFLNQAMGLDLSVEDITALENRTEGWIAGLQLVALAVQGTVSIQGHKDATSLIKSFSGSHRFVLDYLIEEVLNQLSESVQTFLLHTSILDRLTGSLCDAVRFGTAKSPTGARSGGTAVRFGTAKSPTGQDNGQVLLERLDTANLFIVPLDEERRWYRYHYLFSDLLRQRLHQTQLDQLPTLHRRASEWYEQNGFVDEATEHALRTQDYARAIQLIEEHADALWTRGEHDILRRWLVGLPDEVLFSKPQLCIFHAWYLFASGQQDAGERCLQVAEETFEPSADRVAETSPLDLEGQKPDAERAKLRGRAAAIRAVMASYRGDVPGIIQHARQALAYLPDQDVSMRSVAAIALGNAYGFRGEMAAAYQARLEAVEASKSGGNTYFSILAHLEVAITLREQGRLQRTIEICQQQVQLAEKSGLSQASIAGCLLAVWGEALAEQGDLEAANRQAKKGVERTAGGDLAMLGWSYICLMRVLFSSGDLSAAQEIVQQIEHIARESDVPPWITNQMAAWQALLWLAQGRLEAASRWVRGRALVAGGDPKPAHELDFFTLNEYVVLARILIAQERLDETTRLLQRLLEAAEAGGRTTRVIEILNLQALAFQAGGGTAQALTALERALVLAEQGGFMRIFVDEGPPMARLLYTAVTRGIAPDYARQLLAAFPVVEAEQSGPSRTHTPKSEAVEPLSEREIQVLELITEGLTNREIAARLFLSLNTVKAHTRNIYGKLDVHSRTQAIGRSQELGLLSRR